MFGDIKASDYIPVILTIVRGFKKRRKVKAQGSIYPDLISRSLDPDYYQQQYLRIVYARPGLLD